MAFNGYEPSCIAKFFVLKFFLVFNFYLFIVYYTENIDTGDEHLNFFFKKINNPQMCFWEFSFGIFYTYMFH